MKLISLINCKQCRTILYQQPWIDLLSKFPERLTHVETWNKSKLAWHPTIWPAHIWLIASLTAELFPVGGEFVKVWLFWWVISDMRHGAAVLHSFHLCSRPRCRLCRPRLLSWQRAPFRVQPSSLWAPEIMKANPIMAMLSALITLYRNKHEIKYSRRNN